MYNQSTSDKQKFVSMLVNNIGYFNKYTCKDCSNRVIKEVNEFLAAHQSYNPREAIRSTADENIFSFLELGGFTQIGNVLFEVYIGIPRNYPGSPPTILVSFNRQNHAIYNEEQLIKDDYIMLEKDNSGDEFVRLRLPVIDKRWNPTHQTLLAAYNELMQIINRPPIICEKNAPKVRKVNQRKIERKLTLENSEIKGIIENLESEAEKTLIAKNQLLDSELKLDYLICREKFLSEHLPNVKNAIEMKSWEVASTIEDLKQNLNKIQSDKNCESMLSMTGEDMEKLEILSEQQALKETEVKLRSKIEEDESVKFGHYKKVMKILYDRMFDNQTKVLKSMQ